MPPSLAHSPKVAPYVELEIPVVLLGEDLEELEEGTGHGRVGTKHLNHGRRRIGPFV